MSLLLRGGRVVDPSQDLDRLADVLLLDGVVEAIGEGLEAGEDVEVVDVTDRVVVPGLIDVHVHLREPGQEYKETIESGCRAAAAGGFTAVACMANTEPVNDNRSVTEHILSEARRHPFARVYPIGAISKGLYGEELAEFGQLAAAGVVGLSDDGRPVESADLMRRALSYAQHFDLPVIQHAQDLDTSGNGVMHEGEWSTRAGLPGIPGVAEDIMVARDLLLLELVGGRYHVQHLSTRRSVELIRDGKARGLRVTTEVTPHHLLLTDRAVFETGFSTHTKMNPPLRSESDRQAVMEGLLDGTIDLIASDHAPHHEDEKNVEFSEAPFGIVGLETTTSLCLDRLVKPGLMSLARLVELLSCRPAEVFSLPGGSLANGQPADVTILDLDKEVTIDVEAFESKSRNTPFAGWTLQGAAVRTIVGGRLIDLGS
jgi:dihydroorotase